MSDFASLQARVEKLERQAGVQRNLIVALIALVAVAGTVAGTRAQQQAVSFVNANGNRVTLDANGLVISDKNGKNRVEISSWSTGDGYVQLLDADGSTRRAYLGNNSGNDPDFQLDGPNGKAMVDMVGAAKPEIYYYDTAGTERAVMGLTTGNDPLIRMFGTNGSKLVNIEATSQPFMRIYDGNETERMYWGMTSDGDTSLEMWSSAHVERAYFGIYTDASAGTTFYNTAGAVEWHSP